LKRSSMRQYCIALHHCRSQTLLKASRTQEGLGTCDGHQPSVYAVTLAANLQCSTGLSTQEALCSTCSSAYVVCISPLYAKILDIATQTSAAVEP
jgi:hypothetical protein